MNIGFIGLGKLGLPACIGFEQKGHIVRGYDVNPNITSDKRPEDLLFTHETWEDGKTDLREFAKQTKNLHICSSLEDVIGKSDIVFLAVQTPHDSLYEGITSIPDSRKDFDYKHLVNSIQNISGVVDKLGVPKIVVVISTVLPGTIRREIMPILSPLIKFCYNPYFIAMGTVVPDLYHPEFILLGSVCDNATNTMIDFYKTITDAPVYTTSLENAEMIKVSYNTFITAKICIANQIMLMCDKLPGTNCEEVMNGLFMGDRRIISKNYLDGGMGDGGGCHPRDNIALSWLSQKCDLKYDFYEGLMKIREHQTEYFIDKLIDIQWKYSDFGITVLGKAFKPNTNIITGSPAMLLMNIAKQRGYFFNQQDHIVDNTDLKLHGPDIYFLATKHSDYEYLNFPNGSVVVDPFRYVKNTSNIVYIPIGIN